jgi:hypothetical protein
MHRMCKTVTSQKSREAFYSKSEDCGRDGSLQYAELPRFMSVEPAQIVAFSLRENRPSDALGK